MEAKKKELRALVRARMRALTVCGADSGVEFSDTSTFGALNFDALGAALPSEAPLTFDALQAALRIERLPQFAAARTVALYCALPDEPPTDFWLSRWADSKRLALPAISGGEMTFRQYTGTLICGAFGIPESASTDPLPPSAIDLMLIPGMAFDRSGHRLGRGRGFYDRYLAQPSATHIYKVGVCRPWSLMESVPAEAHDIKMDILFVF